VPRGQRLHQPHAIEAIAFDTTSFMSMFLSVLDHPSMALLSTGLLPPASMYVVESYRTLEKLDPAVAGLLDDGLIDRVRPSRHRAKLLDDSERSVEQVAGDLFEVAQRQTRLFMEPHVGVLGPLRRAIQPDLGLSTYDGHIFSTTHSTAFNFGRNRDPEKWANSIGEALGKYTATLLGLFGLEQPDPAPSDALAGEIEMLDIKSAALYGRGPLGRLPAEIAAGATLLLASLNYYWYVVRGLLPAGGHTQFRLKFIAAYHADSNLRFVQNCLASDSSLPTEVAVILRGVLGNPDSRWLRRRGLLRNVLAHYLVDERRVGDLPLDADRSNVIQQFIGERSYADVDELLDRHVMRMSRALERGFDLDGNPFRYGWVA
jgi:hypothetical protein